MIKNCSALDFRVAVSKNFSEIETKMNRLLVSVVILSILVIVGMGC